jgi:hypothetical protein
MGEYTACNGRDQGRVSPRFIVDRLDFGAMTARRRDRECGLKLEMARIDLTDFEWSVIQQLLPTKPRGVPRVDDRRVLNGIFWL